MIPHRDAKYGEGTIISFAVERTSKQKPCHSEGMLVPFFVLVCMLFILSCSD